MDMCHFLHFQSESGSHLVAVEQVVEVIPMVALQANQATESANFCGLLNYRGHIVPVFTLNKKASDKEFSVDSFLIVTHLIHLHNGAVDDQAQSMVAIHAKEVDYLVDIQEEDISSIRPVAGEPFTVANLNGEMLRVINPGDFLQ